MGARYHAASISDIRSPIPREPGSYEWKPVRQHFGVQSFGVNLMVAPEAGDWVVEEHTELADSDTSDIQLAGGHQQFGAERRQCALLAR